MILPIDNNCILTNETHSDDVVKYCDTNDDGMADKRDVFYTGVGVGRDGNVEHEQSGFIWGLDNWIYSTYNSFRFRWTPDGIQREPTAPNGASWGLTEDDDGKMWFINAGAERGPVNFQFPIQYGALTLDDGFEPGFDTVWPAPSIGDMQGGMRRVRQPLGALNHFTATAGAQIARTDRYPQDMHGDLLFAEPVGRLIRRAQIVKTAGLTQLRNVYPGSEFVLGTDPLFRPVNSEAGAGRRDLHRRHVPRHHPGSAVDAARIVPAREDRAVPAGQDHRATAASGGCASTAGPQFRPSEAIRRSPPCRPSRSTRRNRGCWTRPHHSWCVISNIRTDGGATQPSGCWS